jgi:hypothetical protein
MDTTIVRALKLANKIRKGYQPSQMLSDNSKTCISINLPIQGHCTPTKRCVADCYAKYGHTARPSNLRKQKFISNYLTNKNIDLMISECRQFVSVRLNGTGDLLPAHVPQLFSLAKECPQTTFWGMTRKLQIAKTVNEKLPNLSLLVSVDTTSPKSVWNYDGFLCFGPRRPEDKVPDDSRIITVFPRHHHGKIVGKVPVDQRDCPAIRKTLHGCIECQKCWSWYGKA